MNQRIRDELADLESRGQLRDLETTRGIDFSSNDYLALADSPALREADLRWSADALDHWLTDPRKFVPGARMPSRVLDPATRRDIIAYLERQGRPAVAAGTAPKSPQ